MIGIEALIKQNKSFVIYRVPEEEPVLILQSAGPSFSLNELDEAGRQEGICLCSVPDFRLVLSYS